MGVHIVHSLADLERDLRTVTREFKPQAARAVRDVATDGNRAGARFARRSAGRHGKHYHKAFSAERFAGSSLTWVWGPDAGMPQGGMSFERGSRNQPPHHDIAKGADLHGAPQLAVKAHGIFDRLFWP